MNTLKQVPETPEKLLFHMGCAGATFRTINIQYENPSLIEEKATGPLCGGILRQGYQCGMLWGASLAVGAEANRKYIDKNIATIKAIEASRQMIDNFPSTAKHINCNSITGCNQANTWGLIKYMITGKTFRCKRLVGQWAPLAAKKSDNFLDSTPLEQIQQPISCASIVAHKLGASPDEAIMVAGFAGGIGLSGNACGALATAIYIKSLEWYKKNPNKTDYGIPETKAILNNFKRSTQGKFECDEICGMNFKNIANHTLFIKNGGCRNLINILVNS